LLEEILDLARNQSRSFSPDLFDLSDEDRKEIIEGRIARAVRSIDPSAGGVISTGISGKNITMTLDGKKKYSVIMPVDVNLDDVIARTLAQIQEPNT